MAPEYGEHDTERWVSEAAKASTAARSPFERDRARVLHSAAFRRLAAKTQVVGAGVEDFPRTRLTHSLECAQIGRELAHALGADPDLVDTACLAHDLGHPPFGHNGEIALDEAAAPCGGFEGNAQSLRVLVRLETKVLLPDGTSAGLNLTRASLDAATKYPWPASPGRHKYGVYADDAAVFDWLRAGAPGEEQSLEAQVMDWADDVAYSVHDLEDGVQAGLVRLDLLADRQVRDELAELTAQHYSELSPADLCAVLDDLLDQPWWVGGYDGGLRAQAALKALSSELIGRFCRVALAATRQEHGDGPLRRYAASLVVPREVRAECALLKGVTARFVMGRAGAAAAQQRERELVAELVAAVANGAPETLEAALQPVWHEAGDDAGRWRVVVDHVAGLTDVSARRRHRELLRA